MIKLFNRTLPISIGLFLCLSSIHAAPLDITDEEINAINSILGTQTTVPKQAAKSSTADKPTNAVQNKTRKKQTKAQAKESNDANTSLAEALIIAIKEENISKVKKLIKKGADVTPGKGEPLTAAVTSENLEITELLLKNKADPNQAGFIMENSGVLGIAAEDENLEIAKLLLDYRADPDMGSENIVPGKIPDTPLYIAVNNDDIEMVLLLLGNGANTKLTYSVTQKPSKNRNEKNKTIKKNLLSLVDKEESPELYKLLVEHGVVDLEKKEIPQ
jgi:ankyrin repeat protein